MNSIASNSSSCGRPSLEKQQAGFFEVTNILEENYGEVFSITELCKMMTLNGCQPFSTQYMKKKLLDHFGEKLTIISDPCRPDVVSLKSTLDDIILNFYKKPQQLSAEAEKIRIVETAAEIIRCDIQSVKCNHDLYDIF